MAEEHDPEQGREVADPEYLPDQAAGQRHGTEPEQPERRGEDIDGQRRLRGQQEHRDDQCPHDVEPAEQSFLGIAPAERAAGIGADDVEDADQGQSDGAGRRRQAEVHQIGRQVDRDEHDLETANEKAEGQVEIAAVADGFAQGLAKALRRLRRMEAVRGFGAPGNGEGQGNHQQRQHGHAEEGAAPSQVGDQGLADGGHGELAEGTAGTDQAEGHAAAVLGDPAGDRSENDRKAGGRHGNADQQTAAEIETVDIGHPGHDDEASGIDQPSRRDHAAGTEAVGEHAGHRLEHPPEQVLYGHGEGESLAPEPEITGHRRQEQAEGLADSHGQAEDQPAAEDDQDGLSHGGVLPPKSKRAGKYGNGAGKLPPFYCPDFRGGQSGVRLQCFAVFGAARIRTLPTRTRATPAAAGAVQWKPSKMVDRVSATMGNSTEA